MDELKPGREVRFRRHFRSRWQPGTIAGPADSGSALWVRDSLTGASRCLRLDEIEVEERGPKGGVTWSTLAARMGRPVQGQL